MGFEVVYNWDRRRFLDRKDAIAHGFTLDRSDDFNIGVLQDGKLISLDWMDKRVDDKPEFLRRVSLYIGFSA
jgi:hypothetical protein